MAEYELRRQNTVSVRMTTLLQLSETFLASLIKFAAGRMAT